VSFSLVDNLDRVDFSGFELVVFQAQSANPDFSGDGSFESYTSSGGIQDRVGNAAPVANFRVTSDKSAPELEVLSQSLETGVRIRVSDDRAGVDPSSIVITETSRETGQTQEFTTASEQVTFNEEAGIITFQPSGVANNITVTVGDAVGNTASVDVLSESETLTVADFHNFPNPFNSDLRAATVTFTLSKDAVVTIEAYDFLGRKVRTLVTSQSFGAGENTLQFTGVADSGDQLANGVYFLRLLARDGDRQEEAIFKSVIAKD
jgi:hypothetical protein